MEKSKFPMYYCYYSGINHEYEEVWNEEELAQAQHAIDVLHEGHITNDFLSACYWYQD